MLCQLRIVVMNKVPNSSDVILQIGSIVDRVISFSNHQKLLTTLI